MTSPSPHLTQWARERERGGSLPLRMMTWLSLHLSHGLGELILLPVTGWFLATSPAARAASRDYLRRVLGRPVRAADIARHFFTFAQAILDRVFFLAGQAERYETEVEGLDHLLTHIEAGRGCVLLGAHLGSFDAMRALGRHAPVRVRPAMFRANAGALTAILDRLDPVLAARIIDIGRPEAMLQVREALADGDLVAFLADRATDPRRLIALPFLGAPALFPAGPFQIATMLRAPMVMFHGIRTGRRRYVLRFEPLPGDGARTEASFPCAPLSPVHAPVLSTVHAPVPLPRHPPARPGDLSRHGAWTDPPVKPGDDGQKKPGDDGAKERGGEREKERTSTGTESPASNRATALHETMTAYVARLETMCRAHPFQWFNFHDFWRPDTMPRTPPHTTPGRAPHRALTALALSVALLAAPGTARAADDPSALLDTIMGLLAARPGHQNTFREEKTVPHLTRPLVSSGVLIYRRPDHMEKRTLSPLREDLVVDGRRASVTAGDNPPHVLDVDAHAELRVVIDTFIGILSGDLNRLRADFDVTAEGSTALWRITLLPRGPEARKLLRGASVTGRAGAVREVRLLLPRDHWDVMTVDGE